MSALPNQDASGAIFRAGISGEEKGNQRRKLRDAQGIVNLVVSVRQLSEGA